MGSGDRMSVLEQNLHKIWILDKWNYFDNQPNLLITQLASMFEAYFQSKTKKFNPNAPSISDLQKQADKIKAESNFDIIEHVSKFIIDKEENGYACFVLADGRKFVHPYP